MFLFCSETKSKALRQVQPSAHGTTTPVWRKRTPNQVRTIFRIGTVVTATHAISALTMLVTDSAGIFRLVAKLIRFRLRHFLDKDGGRIVPRCCLSETPFASVISYLLREWGAWGFHAEGCDRGRRRPMQ